MALEQKIQQMYNALEEMELTGKLNYIKPEFRPASGGGFSWRFDFTKGADAPTAANRVSQLIANIACLKNHLRTWCVKNGKTFEGEKLINSNRDVAIVHDLWNLDKHSELDRSRSGLFPRLREPARSAIVLRGGGPGGEQSMITIPMFGGPIQATGAAALRISAVVVDQDGKDIDDLENICTRAVSAWEAEFQKVGLTF